jgi:hypothetical protein
MVYKQVLFPDKKNHSIEMPEQFFGKKVEVIVVELSDSTKDANPIPPAGKAISINELFESFGTAPDFPSIEKIRDKAWPSKW